MKAFYQTFSIILGSLSAIIFFIVIISFIINFLLSFNNKSNFNFFKGEKTSNNIIAIIDLSGPIINKKIDFNFLNRLNLNNFIYPELIKKYLKDLEKQKIKGLIINIDSPGGSVSASNQIYKLLVDFKNKNNLPIYFQSNEIMASGAYWVAMAGDNIYANYGSIIGSIGVKGPDWIYYNTPTTLSKGMFGQLIESQKGIKLFSNTAGISKDIFNPFREPSDIEIKLLENMVNNIYIDFVNLVSKSRKIEKEVIINEIGAMIYNTEQAFNNHLIDGEQEIDQTIKSLANHLNLKSTKIIINKTKNNNHLLELNSILNTMNINSSINNKKNIDRFCNNLFNGFSVVVMGNYNNYC